MILKKRGFRLRGPFLVEMKTVINKNRSVKYNERICIRTV